MCNRVHVKAGEHMDDEFWKQICNTVVYKGCFPIDNMLEYNIKRVWSVQRSNVKYQIEIVTLVNSKNIQIITDKQVQFKKIYAMLCNVLGYECLYDGRFFAPESITIDGVECISKIQEYMLAYYSGSNYYTKFSQPMNDTKYKQGFCAWERFDKEYRLMNQMYHNMGYGKGITSDLRLALLTEVSEPLSKLLESKKLISIEKENPTRIQKITCPNCGGDFEREIKLDATFADKIRAIISNYGNEVIFSGDDIDTIIKRTVNTRNKLLHVNYKKKEILSGGECGFYIKKYVDMYRIILMKNLGIYTGDNQKELEDSVKKINENFPQLRIKKKLVRIKKTN